MPKRRMIKRPLTDEEFRKIVGDARAFREAAFFMERRIDELKARSDTLSPIYGDKGSRSHDVWESLKTVSHFNLHNAFELGLKAFLGSIGAPFFLNHFLKGLYAAIPEKEAKKLNALFLEVSKDQPVELEAFVFTKESSPPLKRPKNAPLNSLKGFCEYFDKDVVLWNKRYSWEEVSKEKWMHYISNLGVFLMFLDELEKLSIDNRRNQQGSKMGPA